jgi:hypothetical protein
MKADQLFHVAEFLMSQELRKFQSRIANIFNEVTIELKDQEDEIVLQILADMARERFKDFYPDEPFFESVFNHEKTFFELFYNHDDIEGEDFQKVSEKLRERRKEEEFIYH